MAEGAVRLRLMSQARPDLLGGAAEACHPISTMRCRTCPARPPQAVQSGTAQQRTRAALKSPYHQSSMNGGSIPFLIRDVCLHPAPSVLGAKQNTSQIAFFGAILALWLTVDKGSGLMLCGELAISEGNCHADVVRCVAACRCGDGVTHQGAGHARRSAAAHSHRIGRLPQIDFGAAAVYCPGELGRPLMGVVEERAIRKRQAIDGEAEVGCPY